MPHIGQDLTSRCSGSTVPVERYWANMLTAVFWSGLFLTGRKILLRVSFAEMNFIRGVFFDFRDMHGCRFSSTFDTFSCGTSLVGKRQDGSNFDLLSKPGRYTWMVECFGKIDDGSILQS